MRRFIDGCKSERRAWLVAHKPNPYCKSSEGAFQTAITRAANRFDEVKTERRTLAGMEGEFEPSKDAKEEEDREDRSWQGTFECLAGQTYHLEGQVSSLPAYQSAS